MMGEPNPDMLAKYTRQSGSLYTFSDDDKGPSGCQPAVVKIRNYRGFSHRGVGQKGRLHLDRGYPHTLGFEAVIRTSDMIKSLIAGPLVNISRPDPSLVEHVRGQVRASPVLSKRALAADP